MFCAVDANGVETAEIGIDEIIRAGLQDDLKLIIMLKAVGVLAITAIGRAAAGLDEGGVPGLRPQRA
jgi:hypothetical protein